MGLCKNCGHKQLLHFNLTGCCGYEVDEETGETCGCTNFDSAPVAQEPAEDRIKLVKEDREDGD